MKAIEFESCVLTPCLKYGSLDHTDTIIIFSLSDFI